MGWLVGNLLANVLVGYLWSTYLSLISPYHAVLIAVVIVLWAWSRHWVEDGTEAEEPAMVTAVGGGLAIFTIFTLYQIPSYFAFLGTTLSYGFITAIPDKAKDELFQALGKVYGFVFLILIALSGLGIGWILRQIFMRLS